MSETSGIEKAEIKLSSAQKKLQATVSRIKQKLSDIGKNDTPILTVEEGDCQSTICLDKEGNWFVRIFNSKGEEQTERIDEPNGQYMFSLLEERRAQEEGREPNLIFLRTKDRAKLTEDLAGHAELALAKVA